MSISKHVVAAKKLNSRRSFCPWLTLRCSIFSRARPASLSLGRKHSRRRRKAREQTLFLIHTGHYLGQCCAINTAVEPIKRTARSAARRRLYRRSFFFFFFLSTTCAPLDLVPLPTCRLMRRDGERNRKESAVWFSRGFGRRGEESGGCSGRGEKWDARERRKSLVRGGRR